MSETPKNAMKLAVLAALAEVFPPTSPDHICECGAEMVLSFDGEMAMCPNFAAHEPRPPAPLQENDNG